MSVTSFTVLFLAFLIFFQAECGMRSLVRCCVFFFFYMFFFQAEDGIRDLVRSRGLGDVYKRQVPTTLGRYLGHQMGR